MARKASIEWLVGVIRSGPDFNDHGDPYNFACTVVVQDGEAFLVGAVGEFSRETYRAIKKELVERYGITKIHWKKKNNKTRDVEKDFS